MVTLWSSTQTSWPPIVHQPAMFMLLDCGWASTAAASPAADNVAVASAVTTAMGRRAIGRFVVTGLSIRLVGMAQRDSDEPQRGVVEDRQRQ